MSDNLFNDPDKLISDLNDCCKFDISDTVAKVAVMWIAKFLSNEDVAVDADGNPRKARPRERLAAINALTKLESANLRRQSLIAEIKGLKAALVVEGRMALDLDAMYRDTGIIDVDPIAQRLEEERNSGGNGRIGGNGNGKSNGNGNGNGHKPVK